MANYVFGNPLVAGQLEFDLPTALGGALFVLPATEGEVTATGFVGTLVTGFVGQATLGELETTGFTGGLAAGNSLNALMGEVTVTGRNPGSEAKPNGLHYFATDVDGDPISFEIVTQPSFGVLTVEFNGAILYAPNRGFSGVDSFTWRPWSNGEPGNTVAVTFTVEPQRQALTGEAEVTGFASALNNPGFDTPAELGELTTTGFSPLGLELGFIGQALLGEIETTGLVPNLQGNLQALTGELTVTGFAGVTVAGWINRATVGDVDVTGFTGTISLGWQGQPVTGALDVTGFAPSNLELPHGFVAQATFGQLTTTGYAGAVTADLIAQLGVAGAIIGFAPTLDVTVPPFVWSRQPPPVVFYDPRNHLPDGRTLERETEDELMVYWASQNYRILTAGEISAIIGAPLPTPVIRRELGTGDWPVRKIV